jgi:hypothetical protein
VPEGFVLVHDFLEHQRSAGEIADKVSTKRAAGVKGNHERWHVATGKVDPKCPLCIADGSHLRSQPESQCDPKPSPESESETEKRTTTAVGGVSPDSNARRARGTRLPDDFAVTAEMVEWARDNAPDVDGRQATAAFRDYWRAVPGAKGRKSDWVATWRNWLRNDQKRLDERLGQRRGWHEPERTSTGSQRVDTALGFLSPDDPLRQQLTGQPPALGPSSQTFQIIEGGKSA